MDEWAWCLPCPFKGNFLFGRDTNHFVVSHSLNFKLVTQNKSPRKPASSYTLVHTKPRTSRLNTFGFSWCHCWSKTNNPNTGVSAQIMANLTLHSLATSYSPTSSINPNMDGMMEYEDTHQTGIVGARTCKNWTYKRKGSAHDSLVQSGIFTNTHTLSACIAWESILSGWATTTIEPYWVRALSKKSSKGHTLGWWQTKAKLSTTNFHNYRGCSCSCNGQW